MYALNNGLSAIEDSAGSDARIPGVADVSAVEPDFVFEAAAGAYYGHPDPVRGEYVLNGATVSPTAGPDAVVAAVFSGAHGAGHASDDFGWDRSRSRHPFDGNPNNTLLLVAKYKSAIAADASALKSVVCAGQATIRLDRGLLRTASQNQALRSAAEAQIAADGKRGALDNIVHSRVRPARHRAARASARSAVTVEHVLVSVLSRFSFRGKAVNPGPPTKDTTKKIRQEN